MFWYLENSSGRSAVDGRCYNEQALVSCHHTQNTPTAHPQEADWSELGAWTVTTYLPLVVTKSCSSHDYKTLRPADSDRAWRCGCRLQTEHRQRWTATKYLCLTSALKYFTQVSVLSLGWGVLFCFVCGISATGCVVSRCIHWAVSKSLGSINVEQYNSMLS